MKISTEINSTALRFGEEKAVELVGKAGFDAWDLSMFPMCVLDKMERLLQETLIHSLQRII